MEEAVEKPMMDTSPETTIIVPVWNAESEIEGFIRSFQEVHFPSGGVELVVVDNGSTDATVSEVKRHCGNLSFSVQVVCELHFQSSYAARNRGIQAARGELLVFTDIDCRPDPHWLLQATEAFSNPTLQLAGGNVVFTYRTSRPSGAEWVDAHTNMQIERNIRERGVAKTANLFVRRSLFSEIGLFRSDLRSGGDVEWTRRASQAGIQIKYLSSAMVRHPARGYAALFIKQWRVGAGKVHLRNASPDATTARYSLFRQACEYLTQVPLRQKPGVLFALSLVTAGTLGGKISARLHLQLPYQADETTSHEPV